MLWWELAQKLVYIFEHIFWILNQLIMKLEQLIATAGIYPSNFINVRFWKKTEFSNVIFPEKRSQN